MDITEKLCLSEIKTLRVYLSKHGNINLETLLKIVQGEKIYKCPNCRGKGTKTECETIYGSDGDQGVFHTYKCNLCNGYGYTEVEKKPKMIQTGWE